MVKRHVVRLTDDHRADLTAWTFRVADARVKLDFLYPKEFPR